MFLKVLIFIKGHLKILTPPLPLRGASVRRQLERQRCETAISSHPNFRKVPLRRHAQTREYRPV